MEEIKIYLLVSCSPRIYVDQYKMGDSNGEGSFVFISGRDGIPESAKKLGSSQVIETRQYGRNYYHCNWGWNGLYNGFYLSGLFDAENGAGIVTRANSKSDHDYYYQYDLDIHTGINPLQ